MSSTLHIRTHNDREQPGGRMGEVFPAPRAFWWLPVSGQRHAICADDRNAPTGAPVQTLCGKTPGRPAPPIDAQWLWRTCDDCWNEACRIVGAR